MFASHPHNNPYTWSKPAPKSHSLCAEFSNSSHLYRTAIPCFPGLQTSWISILLRLLRLLALKLIWSELLLEMNFFGKVKCQPFLVPTSAQILEGIIGSQGWCKKLIMLIRLSTATFEGLSQWGNPGTLPRCARSMSKVHFDPESWTQASPWLPYKQKPSVKPKEGFSVPSHSPWAWVTNAQEDLTLHTHSFTKGTHRPVSIFCSFFAKRSFTPCREAKRNHSWIFLLPTCSKSPGPVTHEFVLCKVVSRITNQPYFICDTPSSVVPSLTESSTHALQDIGTCTFTLWPIPTLWLSPLNGGQIEIPTEPPNTAAINHPSLYHNWFHA